MPKNGPIPLRMHAMIEPIVALLFIAAPFVLDFDSSAARTLSIAIGVVILIVGMTTRWRLSLVKLVPLRMHFAGDVLIGIVALAAPFVFGFSDETAPTVFFLVMGAGELGAAFGTAWRPEADFPAGRSQAGRTQAQSG
jgi:hypothetical protein